MTVPATGPISMTAIGNEEGVPLSNLSINGEVRWLCNKLVPNSTIKFSDFRNTFKIRASYVMITYAFTDGRDMDTRTRIVVPDSGGYVGWGQSDHVGAYIQWGGDNLGTGTESALIDMTRISEAFGGLPTIKVEGRAQWYGDRGYNPVIMALVLWEGGSPVKAGFAWENPTAIHAISVNSVGKVVGMVSREATSIGERVAVLVYDIVHGTGYIDENDTNTY